MGDQLTRQLCRLQLCAAAMTGAAEPSAQAAHADKPADPAAMLPSPAQDPLPAPAASSSRTGSRTATAQSSDLSSVESSSSAEDTSRTTTRPARGGDKAASPTGGTTPVEGLPSRNALPALPGKGAVKKEDRFRESWTPS